MKIDQFKTDVLLDLAAKPRIVFVKGRVSWLIDRRGKRHLDFVQGWAVNSLGHSAQALAKQVSRLVNPSPLSTTMLRLRSQCASRTSPT
jgi:acetylornithine/N-succinyldiaminopimelate aminotransferase